MPGAIVAAPSSQRYSMPDAHQRQCPHTATNDITTWSPGANSVTPYPISTTVPEPSWPPIIGNNGVRPNSRAISLETDMSPRRTWSSEWHRPAAAISTSTSPVRGASSSKSSTDHGPPTSCRIAALLLMLRLVVSAQPTWLVVSAQPTWLVVSAQPTWLVGSAQPTWLVVSARGGTSRGDSPATGTACRRS